MTEPENDENAIPFVRNDVSGVIHGDVWQAGHITNHYEWSTAPARLPELTGRPFTCCCRTLDEILRAAVDGPNRGAVVAVNGANADQTVLHWARRNLDRFPDGQLHVDLRDPVTPLDTIRRFLEELGVAQQDDPEQAYQWITARRRLLIVIDHAVSAEQIAPLLPAHTRSVAVVTSREIVTGLPVTASVVVDDPADSSSFPILPSSSEYHQEIASLPVGLGVLTAIVSAITLLANGASALATTLVTALVAIAAGVVALLGTVVVRSFVPFTPYGLSVDRDGIRYRNGVEPDWSVPWSVVKAVGTPAFQAAWLAPWLAEAQAPDDRVKVLYVEFVERMDLHESRDSSLLSAELLEAGCFGLAVVTAAGLNHAEIRTLIDRDEELLEAVERYSSCHVRSVRTIREMRLG